MPHHLNCSSYLEAIFADNIIVVKLFEDGVQELVRMLQSERSTIEYDTKMKVKVNMRE